MRQPVMVIRRGFSFVAHEKVLHMKKARHPKGGRPVCNLLVSAA
tara:strand:- start:1340 stop:1471 length:132 start_codon:yes stop_codon:yes gene_type:complete